MPRSGAGATIPLVMPGDGEFSGNRLTVTAKEGIQVRQREGAWREDSVAGSLAPGGPRAAPGRHERTGDVSLAIHWDDDVSGGSTVVNRAWVQTWLTASVREDRVAAARSTTQKALDLVVPTGSPSRRRRALARRETGLGAIGPRGPPEGAASFARRIALSSTRGDLPFFGNAFPKRPDVRWSCRGWRTGVGPPALLATDPAAQRAPLWSRPPTSPANTAGVGRGCSWGGFPCSNSSNWKPGAARRIWPKPLREATATC